MIETPRLTSKQANKLLHEPERYVLLCGICLKPIRTQGAFMYQEPLYTHRRFGECHKKCYIATLPPTKRKAYERSMRQCGKGGYVL